MKLKSKYLIYVIAFFLLVVVQSLAKVEIEIEIGEKEIGDECTTHYECATWLCKNNVCTTCVSDEDCNETTSLCINGICKECTSDTECKTLLCSEDKKCTKCDDNSDCFTNLCNITTGYCQYCSKNEDCETLRCEKGICEKCSENLDCETYLCDTASGFCRKCKSNDECETNLCDVNTGKCYCKWLGEKCNIDKECCSGICVENVCVSSFKKEELVKSSKIGSTKEGEGAIRIERNRSVISDLVFNITGWSRRIVSYKNKCAYGVVCNSSDDCCGAPCVDGHCKCGKIYCASSGECCEGYCEGNICVKSPSTGLFLYDSFLKQLSNPFGCYGIIDECLPGEIGCIYLCNGLLGILIVISIALFIVSWYRFNNVVIGALFTIVNLLIGLSTYPIAGIFVGIFLVALIQYIKAPPIKTFKIW